MSYLDEAFLPHLRLTLLRILAVAPAYSSNSSILHEMAAQMGLPATRDQVRAELAWLAEMHLVSNQEPAAGLIVATITERGFDVQGGATSVPGVKRPGPKA